MKSNTSRRLRTAFDHTTDMYDRTRPRWNVDLVQRFFDHGTLVHGDPVLEIGAGTGQLTEALLDFGFKVVALEPGHQMAKTLRRKFGRQGHFQVVEEFFEEFESEVNWAGIFAANSFHWLDPKVSYGKAHALLSDHGCLYTLWNFPIIADTLIQQRLNNEVFIDELSDLKRDPNGFNQEVQRISTAGIQELNSSGYFRCKWHEILETSFEMDLATYATFLSSYAGSTGLQKKIQRMLMDVCDSEMLVLKNYVSLRIADRISFCLD